jgi:hypothetical protein
MFELNQRSLFMNRIQIFLSRRGTGILLTLISIIAINCWQQILRNYDNDNVFSIAAAKNISEGHGYSIKTASADDLSKYYYDPLNRWPPGYSWLLVFMHKLFNTDWIHTSYFLNAIGLTALVLIFRKMLFQLEYPEWIVNITVLYFGFLLHSFHYSFYSDIFGLLFFLLGLSIILKGIKSEKNMVLMSMLAAFSFGFSTYLKYLYIPLSLLPIISLFIYGYIVRRKDFQSAAIKGFILLIIIIVSLLLFQYFNSGQSLYINPSKTGFFPDQLFGIAPVIPYGLINMLFLNMQLSLLTHFSFPALHIFWQMVYLCCVVWLFYISYKLFRFKIFRIKDFRSFYAIQACIFTIVLFSYLIILSVTKNKHYPDTYFEWVYGQELRYYSVFIVFVMQFIILLFLKQEYFFNKTGKIIFRSIVGFILFIEITHGAYFCFRGIVVEKNYGVRIGADQFLFKSMELTKKELEVNKSLVFCSNNYTIANMCSLENVPVFYDLGKLKNPIPHSLPVTLLIAIDTTVPGTSVPILSNPAVKPDFIFKNVNYYFVNLPKPANF